MRRSVFLTLFLLLAGSILSFAKAGTSKITIQGGGLLKPIEITDPATLSNFKVWAGPATSSNENKSLVVDWSAGRVAAPPNGLQRYRVSFYARMPEEKVVYVVFYELDPTTKQGYVYLPGEGEEFYELNVRSIVRFVEGNWFHAWEAWDKVAQPLVIAASASASNRPRP